MNAKSERDIAMEHFIHDELNAPYKHRNANNMFIVTDDDDGLTGELASLDSLSSLQEELSMSSHCLGQCSANNMSKAEIMDSPVALIEEEDYVFTERDSMEKQECTRWKPTPSVGQDNSMPSETPKSPIERFTQMARQTKLAEDVLVENGVERSLARQLAVSVNTSKAAMESQRQWETQRLMIQSRERNRHRLWLQRQHEQRIALESYHRNQDRQWSQRQHEESMQANKYDKDWSQKLEKKRDQCWTVVTQMGQEALAFHYLSIMLIPMSIKDLANLGMHSICDCESSIDKYLLSSMWDAMSGTRGLKDLIWHVDYMTNDSGLCYSSCMFMFGAKIGGVAAVHMGLRLISAPPLLHQMVNLAAVPSLLGGPIDKLLGKLISLEALLSFSRIHLLVIVLLVGYAVTLWKTYSCKKRVQEASKCPVAFAKVFEPSLQHLETLHSQLVVSNYLVRFGGFLAVLYYAKMVVTE